jgi:hypothetical protein
LDRSNSVKSKIGDKDCGSENASQCLSTFSKQKKKWSKIAK